MAVLNVMVGIPGSGKSYVAKDKMKAGDIIVSSDDIREELFGDASSQEDNPRVFRIFHDRIKQALREGKNVWADATNITLNTRKQYFQYLGKNDICIAHLILARKETCVARSLLRERKVGKDVIDKMINRFEMPIPEEGFEIIVNTNNDVYFGTEIDNISVEDYEHYVMKKAAGFQQTSKWHQEDLYQHLTTACRIMMNRAGNSRGSQLLMHSALLHDCGKLFTRTLDENGYHFYHHANVGAYDFLTWVNDKSMKPFELSLIAMMINYHDHIYRMREDKFDKTFKEFGDLLRIMHEVDIAASRRA